MTGKVLDNSATGILVLILPVALAIVVLFTAWPWLLLLIALSIGWRIWQNYQWQQWCQKVNPSFQQLIKENRGCLTPIDLSLKANLTAGAAERFLEKKAEEYGAQRKVYKDKGTVYYFLTASALGSIFEDSEPPLEEESEGSAPKKTPQLASAFSELKERARQSSAIEIAQLVEIEESKPSSKLEKESSAQEESIAGKGDRELLAQEPETQAERASAEKEATHLSLIQAELAKRLELNSSTVGRRKSDPDFPDWSRTKDPEGIAWKYLPETKMFVPLDAEEESS